MADHAHPAGELKDAPLPDATTEAGKSLDEDASGNDAYDPTPGRRWPLSPVGAAIAVGVVTFIVLTALGSWLGIRAYQSHRADQQRDELLEVARQGAINLTTIDYRHADADIQRILDSATGSFYDDFSKRSTPFVDVVKQAQSMSEGNVTGAGIESETADGAYVLVAVTVKTTNPGAPQQDPRLWRMRLSVQKVGDQEKVANVAFVP